MQLGLWVLAKFQQKLCSFNKYLRVEDTVMNKINTDTASKSQWTFKTNSSESPDWAVHNTWCLLAIRSPEPRSVRLLGTGRTAMHGDVAQHIFPLKFALQRYTYFLTNTKYLRKNIWWVRFLNLNKKHTSPLLSEWNKDHIYRNEKAQEHGIIWVWRSHYSYFFISQENSGGEYQISPVFSIKLL